MYQYPEAFMKKQSLKYRLKDILAIAFSWLLAILILYVIFLKVKLLFH